MFRILAFLSPLLAGLLVPFLLALARDRKWSRPAALAAAPLGVVSLIVLLLMAWIPSGDRFSCWLELSCFLLAFGVLLFGLFHLLLGLGRSTTLAQIGTGLLVLLMVGTLFYFDPLLEQVREAGTLHTRVEWAMKGNPYVVVASSIFEEDVLTRPFLYRHTLLADLPRSYPEWPPVALGYVVLGFFSYVGYLGMQALRLRGTRGK